MLKLNFRHHTPKNSTFWKVGNLPFWWKHLVCGLNFEISECPIKLPYVTYSSYKYELDRIKTHEIRAKYFLRYTGSFNNPFPNDLKIFLFVKIFRLRVKFRNFWVPNKTSICHLLTLKIWARTDKNSWNESKKLLGSFFSVHGIYPTNVRFYPVCSL